MKETITWVGSADDQTARINDYVLRVEHLDFGLWWASVSHKDEEEVYTIDALTEGQAKTACEKAYYEHLNKK